MTLHVYISCYSTQVREVPVSHLVWSAMLNEEFLNKTGGCKAFCCVNKSCRHWNSLRLGGLRYGSQRSAAGWVFHQEQLGESRGDELGLCQGEMGTWLRAPQLSEGWEIHSKNQNSDSFGPLGLVSLSAWRCFSGETGTGRGFCPSWLNVIFEILAMGVTLSWIQKCLWCFLYSTPQK